ncbi:HAD-IA family hydrolase [Rhodobaculum claviforme]|uniref:Haloacid dehalogenase n=1 Tax=Rhodobaculum claviforme TaxID=1549854 RepID=A0A934TLN3_9RHOB|nr:HAD-IA family hydrolase [Rhodobaculum claviforme]MBK5927432.1 haloacid dehalogenase [Rhodobaculum claviforme]
MPSAPAPAAVVLDIGNVLVGWDPVGVYDRAIGHEARARLFAEVDLEVMNLEVDRGRPLVDAVAERAARHPAHADHILLWSTLWRQMFAPVIAPSVATLRALKSAGVPVFALSNFGRETFAMAEADHDFLRLFDRRFLSGELGTLKPEPEIYAALEGATGLSGAALLFADDRADNIAAAAARGWRTHHFTDPAAWAARLVAEGVLTAEEAAP